MASIRGRDTGPELALRRALRAIGLTGYRLHRRDLPGRPDLAFMGPRVAVFVHGCFWHGCLRHYRAPGGPRSAFWHEKISRNIARDWLAADRLVAAGWSVVVAWEHDPPELAADYVRRAVELRRA